MEESPDSPFTQRQCAYVWYASLVEYNNIYEMVKWPLSCCCWKSARFKWNECECVVSLRSTCMRTKCRKCDNYAANYFRIFGLCNATAHYKRVRDYVLRLKRSPFLWATLFSIESNVGACDDCCISHTHWSDPHSPKNQIIRLAIAYKQWAASQRPSDDQTLVRTVINLITHVAAHKRHNIRISHSNRT